MGNPTPRKDEEEKKNIPSNQCTTPNWTNKRKFYCFNEKASIWDECRIDFYLNKDLKEIEIRNL